MLAALYALSVAVLTVYGGNLLWMAVAHADRDRLRDGPIPDPETLPPLPNGAPHVTVQLPLYNEPLVAERLIDACANLDYPFRKLEIQVLDDSTDATTRKAASRVAHWQSRGVDIVHVRRLHREGFKAGALQNGLRIARGDFLAVFDADFVPAPRFLRRILPQFDDDRVGLVQARWGHLNAEASLLTRIQSVGLDMHFAVEQRIRSETGCFMSFNGTAGVWRRACIEDAGGWHGDTIAEDLDLSYRAQMAGWRFRYVDDLEVPAELPATMRGLRSQQFRWAKGSVETARKLVAPLWRSDLPGGVKLQGTIHLTAHAVFPFVLMAVLLHAPLLVAEHAGAGPGTMYFGWMALGLIGFVGFSLAQLLAQRSLYFDWRRRLRYLPAFMAGTIGLSLSNSQAVLEALAGKPTAFVRTPKRGDASDTPDHALRRSRRRPPGIAWLELVLLAYSVAGLVLLVAIGEWAAVPFQLLFTTGFALVSAANFPIRGTGGFDLRPAATLRS